MHPEDHRVTKKDWGMIMVCDGRKVAFRNRGAAWVFSLVWLVLFCFTRTGEYPTPAGYNDRDYQKLATFLELPNGEGKNGHKLNADYDPADPTTWTGVYWDSGETKRVARISWYSKDLTGSLDLSCSGF